MSEKARPVSIYIGGVYASDRPVEIRTVLGSCVAACLFDPIGRVGGMNHFALADGSDATGLPSRYGVHAMELLINRIMSKGGHRSRLQAKAFGGANVLGMQALRIGSKNANFVRSFLEAEKIPLLAERLGGNDPLEVRFFSPSGRVLLRPVERTTVASLAQEEQRFQRTLVSEPEDEGDITLF